MEELFYLEDTRSVCGNSMMWWAANDSGYTCDIRCARVWTQDELDKRFDLKERGLPSKYRIQPKAAIDRIVQHHVDHQDLGSKSPHTLRTWRPDLIK